MVSERKRWMRMRDRECRKRGRADQGERRSDRQTAREDKRESLKDRQTEGKGETGKTERKNLGGAYYMAVTPLWCGSEWEELSTHYSSDLGGQLEESSINQTDAQAEADDSRQQCPQQQPPHPQHHTHKLTYTLTHSHTHQHRLQCFSHTHLPPSTVIFLLYFLLFSFFSVAFYISHSSLFISFFSVSHFSHHSSLSFLLFVCPNPSQDPQLQTVN